MVDEEPTNAATAPGKTFVGLGVSSTALYAIQMG